MPRAMVFFVIIPVQSSQIPLKHRISSFASQSPQIITNSIITPYIIIRQSIAPNHHNNPYSAILSDIGDSFFFHYPSRPKSGKIWVWDFIIEIQCYYMNSILILISLFFHTQNTQILPLKNL